MSENGRSSETPDTFLEDDAIATEPVIEAVHLHRESVRGKFRLVLTTLGAMAALINGNNGDGHGSCSGCHVCSPPPIVKKDKEDDDENDEDNNES